MDVVTHALVGASTGAVVGRPLLGAVIAALPDVVLGLRRRAVPSRAYNATHSAAFVAAATLAAALLFAWPVAPLVALCLLSHLVLDLPTHSTTWAPPLLYPFSARRFSFGNEWEFFNESWWVGLTMSIIWITTCLSIVAAR